MSENGHIINFSSNLGTTCNLKNEKFTKKLLKDDLTLEELFLLTQEFESSEVNPESWELSVNEVYGMSKCLVNSFTRVIARDLTEKGSKIRVNAVHPGWVKTDMTSSEAPLSLEEGGVMPFMVATDNSEITGKYWADGHYEDFS